MLGSSTYAGSFLTFASPLVNIVNRNVEGSETVFFRAVTNTNTNHDSNPFVTSVACGSSTYVLDNPTQTTAHPIPI
jgi:hypothetical protein